MAEQTIDITKLALENTRQVESVYANNAGLAITPWDVRVLLSEIVPTPAGGVILEQRANIVMTHSHAKALAIALTNAIAVYEQDHGEIHLPDTGPTPALGA